MLADYPDDIVGLQLHVGSGDPCTVPWCYPGGRWAFYDGYYVPRVQIEGMYVFIGSGEGTYENMFPYVADRLAVPTDVTIELFGDKVGDQTYRVTALVGLEADADAKPAHIHFVNTLYGWPNPADDQYHYCVREGADLGEIDLVPGQKKVVQFDFTFDSDSWAAQDQIHIAAFAQEALPLGPAEVYQAEMMGWPFPPFDDCSADITGDDIVDVLDLLDLLSAWGQTGDIPEDVNGDGIVDVLDLIALLGAWGPC